MYEFSNAFQLAPPVLGNTMDHKADMRPAH